MNVVRKLGLVVLVIANFLTINAVNKVVKNFLPAEVLSSLSEDAQIFTKEIRPIAKNF